MNQIAIDTQILIPQILPELAGGEALKTPTTDATGFLYTLSGAIEDVGAEDTKGLTGDSALMEDEKLADSEALALVPSEKDAPIANPLALVLDLEAMPKHDDDLMNQLVLGDKAVVTAAPVSLDLVKDLPQELGAPIRIKYSDSGVFAPDPKTSTSTGMNKADISRSQSYGLPPTISIETEPIVGDVKVAERGVINAPDKLIAPSNVDGAQPVVEDKAQSGSDTLERKAAKGPYLEGESRPPATIDEKTDAPVSSRADQTAKPAMSEPSKPTGPVNSRIIAPDTKNTDALSRDIVTDKSAETDDGVSKGTKGVLMSPRDAASKPAGISGDRGGLEVTDDTRIEVSKGTVTKTASAGEILVADVASKIQKSKTRDAGRPSIERNAPQPLASQATVEGPSHRQGSDTANTGTPEPVVESRTRMVAKNAGTSADKTAGTEVLSARSISTTPDVAATATSGTEATQADKVTATEVFSARSISTTPDAAAIAARGAEAISGVPNPPAEPATTEPTPRFIVDLPKPLRIPSQIRVRLDPPELGAVRIDLQAGRNGIVGTLRFHSGRTRGVVERDLGQIHRALMEAGVRVERLEVAGGSSAEFRNSLNSQTSGQQHSSQQSSRGQNQQTGPQGNPLQTDGGQPQAASSAWDVVPESMGITSRDGRRGVNLVA